MRIKLITLLIILLIVPLTYGITFFTDEKATLWASCKNNTYAVSTAELTVRYPNGSVWLANVSMSVVSIGIFNYTFITPNTTGNYMDQVICDIGGVKGYDEDDFWVREKEEEMTSLAVVIFLVVITFGVFFLPKLVKRFSENKYLDSTLKGVCIIFGLLLLSLDTAMVVTVADNASLGINKELFRLLWLINWTAYIGMVIVVLGFGWKMLQMWNTDKYNKKMGYGNDEQE